MASDILRFGVIGCGDVANRAYIPGFADFTEQAELVGCCDIQPELAERAAERSRSWSPSVVAYTDLGAMLERAELDAVINITPGPTHGAVSASCLESGVNVYSEKPISISLEEANRLVALATEKDRLLLCAPAMAVSRRIRWLAEIVSSGRLGPLTLAVAQHANTGPAAWREYTGDPEVFYGPGVGPVFDHGVYRLHAMTTLMGSVRRVQAMGGIGNPKRVVRGGPLAGGTVEVTAPDHVLINMEFAGGGLGQLLASFAVPNTRAPGMELHFTGGTISLAAEEGGVSEGVSIFLDDESPLGLEGWMQGLEPPPPADERGLLATGVAHFIACLRGEEKPILTAEHARHVLDITLKAYESIRDGQSHETETAM